MSAEVHLSTEPLCADRSGLIWGSSIGVLADVIYSILRIRFQWVVCVPKGRQDPAHGEGKSIRHESSDTYGFAVGSKRPVGAPGSANQL